MTVSFVELRGPVTTLAGVRPGPDLRASGWSEREYVAHGSAVRYTGADPPADGRWDLQVGGTAGFVSRVVVRRPIDPASFNGTLVVEWLNVSSGQDVAPDWTYLADELVRGGYAWAGVSAQYAGIMGGAAAVAVDAAGSQGLRGQDSARYGDLHHPGDAYCYDVFTQVATAVRDPASGPLAGLDVEVVLAVGESQSGFTLTTYVDGVHPLTGLFDGFLVHSRGGAPAPLGRPGSGLVMAEVIAGTPTRIRDDLSTPVIVVVTETDLLGHLAYLPARQPDSDHVRVWELAGTAHADKYMVGEFEEFLGCPEPVNRGQQAYVVRAALRSLDRWARGGDPPPGAPPLQVVDGAFVTDDNGNALGGVRTPVVDSPVERLSGLTVPGASTLCRLFGSTTPLPGDRLANLYGSATDYLAAYEKATDAAVAAGFVLVEDRDAVLAEARPELASS